MAPAYTIVAGARTSLDPASFAWLGCSVSPLKTPLAPAALVLLAALAPAAARAESPDRARATAMLKTLETKSDHKQALAELLRRSRHALDRAAKANAAADHRHAGELEALALELAQTANDLVRALEAERALAELSRRAIAAETRAVRAQALVEQTAARRGRAAAVLAALEAERAERASGVPAKPAPAPKAPGQEPQR
jgi:hypothetical protein